MIQYSSNEGDLVCDMFLGGFSTAKVAVGLNRRATGFEVSEQVFDLRIEELRDIGKGCLLSALRNPRTGEPENRGRPWTDADRETLLARFTGLIESGETKKRAIETLGRELGRGRWAIEKMLKKQGVRTGGRRGDGT
jgi:site-specific DNA-methyltransferase (adenine-specific)